MTINVNRLVQNAVWDDPLNDVCKDMEIMVEKVHRYLLAFNAILKERREAGLLPVYDAGFVTPEKQYLTVGINGFIEGAESLGIEPDADNPEYVKYAEAVLQPIYEANRRDRSEGIMWNTNSSECECLRNFIATHKNELQEIDDKDVIVAIENIADNLHDEFLVQQLKEIEKKS